MRVLVRGSGVAGLAVAHELVARGATVTIADLPGGRRASWFAGGMLAPYCERESAEQSVVDLGVHAADWWEAALPGSVTRHGTLVVAPARDARELERFGSRTFGHEYLDEDALSQLEPDLVGRFRRALFFRDEAHLDPRQVLAGLAEKLVKRGVRFLSADAVDEDFDFTIECTGYAPDNEALRGVRGEMLLLRTGDVSLSRPVRLIHPRFPVYIVPRPGNVFMVGATMIESDAEGPITARSMMELLNAAYGVHPAFGEAEIVETGVGIRPAYRNNLPRVEQAGRAISINGLYRHGFLLAPAMAMQAADLLVEKGKTPQ